MPKRSDANIEFIETLRLPDGAHAGEFVRLRLWQKLIIRAVYDPVDAVGMRLVRQAILSMARKNGKTGLVAFLCLCHLCGPEAVRNGQLYSLSIDREQAGIIFNYVKNIIYMDEELDERLTVTESRKIIIDPDSGSVFTVLSGEKKGKMGKSSSFIAFDELAEFGSARELYDALMTSTGAHDEPMVWTFSTQAPYDSALLSELIDYGENEDDPTFVSFLYTVPMEEEDIWNEDVWKLANPALGDFRSLVEMRDYAKKAKKMPSMAAGFRNLYLNQRISAATHFIPPEIWKENCGPVDESVFEDVACYGGLDLSAKNDLTALVFTAEDTEGIIHTISKFFTPADTLKFREDRDKAPYSLWVSQGFLTAVPGKTIDYRYIAIELGKAHAKFSIGGIRFDRWRIADLQRDLVSEGVEAWIDGQDDEIPGGLRLIAHGQGFKDMSPAVERLEDALLEGRVRNGKNPVMTMCASNTRVQADPAGGRKFDKIKSTGRIDGIVALAMALSAAHSDDIEGPSVYEERGVLVF